VTLEGSVSVQSSEQRSRSVAEWLAERQTDMISLLAELVNIDSGSLNKAGVDRVGDRMRAFFASHGIETTLTPVSAFGDAIHATIGAGAGRPILLLGHRDTVFADGEAQRRPFRSDDKRAYGPGVADMKAGLVMHCFVLAALKRHGGLLGTVNALFTGDEEVGSPASRAIIEATAKGARAVFNAEPGRKSGNIVDRRKGAVFMRLLVSGKAAHSGSAFDEGISAVEELARKTTRLHTLNERGGGVTVNVGTVGGGQSVNTVAPSAFCTIDLRYGVSAERAELMAAIEEIAGTSYVPGTSARLDVTGEFLPLKHSKESLALQDLYLPTAREIGLDIGSEATGGCADSGFTAAVGAPTLCAVGPVGSNGHSPDEYLEIDSIVPRAQALALTILRLDRP
jgi:glutamate carboxypeptidase